MKEKPETVWTEKIISNDSVEGDAHVNIHPNRDLAEKYRTIRLHTGIHL